jgi:hypothetical protein
MEEAHRNSSILWLALGAASRAESTMIYALPEESIQEETAMARHIGPTLRPIFRELLILSAALVLAGSAWAQDKPPARGWAAC